MRRQGTPVSREALYDEVWTGAVTVVAPRFGPSTMGWSSDVSRPDSLSQETDQSEWQTRPIDLDSCRSLGRASTPTRSSTSLLSC